MQRQHYHLKHCWRPGRTMKETSPMLVLDDHFGYYDEQKRFHAMSNEWDVAFKAHETQNLYEVPGAMPNLIENTCLQNATPHMLAEEIQR
eukprot:10031105-Karenia_brevis.AAC.1